MTGGGGQRDREEGRWTGGWKTHSTKSSQSEII